MLACGILVRFNLGDELLLHTKNGGPLVPVELKNLALSNCALAANSASIANTDCVSASADRSYSALDTQFLGFGVVGNMKCAVALCGNCWAKWELQRQSLLEVLDFVAKVSTKAIFLPRTPARD
eukprot:s1521_g1.t1